MAKRLAYECIGPEGAPVLLLSAGLGGLAAYWTPQLDAYAADHRVILLDHRGTGRNRDDLPDGLTIADMADDALSVLDELGVTRCRFVGHAIGALIGFTMELARPGLIERMVAVNAWARTNPHTVRCFRVRLDLLDHVGVEAFVRAQPIFLLPANWMAAHPDRVAADEAAAIAHFAGADTVKRRIGAALPFDIEASLSQITMPVLVVAARDDVLVPSDCSVALADGLPGGVLAMQAYGGHACNVTEVAAFNALTVPFLRGE
jgi:aminoacrylate hydrolase